MSRIILDKHLIAYLIGHGAATQADRIAYKMNQDSFLNQVAWLSIFLLGLMGLTSHTFAQKKTFSHNNFSATLPEGWVMQDIAQGSEKELIGSSKSRDIPGTSLLIFCYKGRRYHYSSVRVVGLKTIASVFPKGQEMLKKETKVKTDGGLAAVVELWKGVADEGRFLLPSSPHGNRRDQGGLDTDAGIYARPNRAPIRESLHEDDSVSQAEVWLPQVGQRR